MAGGHAILILTFQQLRSGAAMKMTLGDQEIKGVGSFGFSVGFIKTRYQINLDIDASPAETEKLIKDIDSFIFQRTQGQCAYDAMTQVSISSSVVGQP